MAYDLEYVEAIGKHKTMAHLNFGEFDKRNGFYEVDEPEYPPEAVAAGGEIRAARIAASLGLREAARLVGLRPVQLSSIERGHMRLVNEADAKSILATYAANSSAEKQLAQPHPPLPVAGKTR